MLTLWIVLLDGGVKAVFDNWKSAYKYQEEHISNDIDKIELVCKVVSK